MTDVNVRGVPSARTALPCRRSRLTETRTRTLSPAGIVLTMAIIGERVFAGVEDELQLFRSRPPGGAGIQSCSLNVIVIVISTGTGTPFSCVGL